MNIYIYNNGQQEGPYTVDILNRRIAQGTLSTASAFAWHENAPDWIPLDQIVGITRPPAVLPPPIPMESAPQIVQIIKTKTDVCAVLCFITGAIAGWYVPILFCPLGLLFGIVSIIRISTNQLLTGKVWLVLGWLLNMMSIPIVIHNVLALLNRS